MAQKIPVPVTFNPYKHHSGFLLQQLKTWQSKEWHEVTDELKSMGNNLIDLYYGKLTVSGICNECLTYFEIQSIYSPEKFLEWLPPKEYRKIELSDTSLWVIKEGINNRRYIHIHPAKNSPFTLRVRAATLKTVIALKIQEYKLSKTPVFDLQNVNYVRINYLGLSPLKAITPGKGISRIWDLFNLP
ncbi:MAG: hypothetical protein ACQETJ_04470 [Bacteroidota bacterium]